MNHFMHQLQAREAQVRSVMCIGLDTVPERLPEIVMKEPDPQYSFNKAIIDATHDLVCCYKPNLAFYLSRGEEGMAALRETIEYVHEKEIPVIVDAKFGDIGHTAKYYAKSVFEKLQADAVTLNPYMGEESIEPFRAYKDKTSFILCFTSNASRNDLQTKFLHDTEENGKTVYNLMAKHIVDWNKQGNLGAVVGATAPEEMQIIRGMLGGEIPVLCPGLGAQGGDLEEIFWAGYITPGSLILNVSRSVLFASTGEDFAEAARREAEMLVNQNRVVMEQYEEDKRGA